MNSKIHKSLVKLLIIGTLLLMNNLDIRCQDTLTYKKIRNSIHLDCASAFFIGMYSVNYERIVINSNHYKLLLNTGFGGWYFVPWVSEYFGYSIPLSLNNLVGSGNSYFEIDLGLRYTFLGKRSDKDRFQYVQILNLGYRYQRPNGKGLIFRSFIGLSGLGIGVGKAF